MRIFLILFCVFSVNLFACFEPFKPICVQTYGGFDSESDFELCKIEVERYIDNLNEYIKCLVDEENEKKLEIIKKFNCKAKGDNFCY